MRTFIDFNTDFRRSQRVRNFMLLTLSFITFMVCSFLALYHLSKEQTEAVARMQEVDVPIPSDSMEVLVSTEDISPGRAFEPFMFKTEIRQKVTLDPEAVIRSYGEIRNLFAKNAIKVSTPLLRSNVTHDRPANVITTSIPPGFRAVSININEKTGVEGWARPGSRVDVSWTGKIRGEESIYTIVQNSLVLSAERNPVDNGKDQGKIPSTITLLVNAADAQKITLAQATGTVFLSLRGTGDVGKGDNSGGISISDLYRAPVEEKTDTVEGFAKFTDSSGKQREWVVVDGNVTPRDKGDAALQ